MPKQRNAKRIRENRIIRTKFLRSLNGFQKKRNEIFKYARTKISYPDETDLV
jgi:hypothetical protein